MECFGFQLASPLPWLGRLPPPGRAKRGKVALDLSCEREGEQNWPHLPSSCWFRECARTKSDQLAAWLLESCQHLENLLNFVERQKLTKVFDSFGHQTPTWFEEREFLYLKGD